MFTSPEAGAARAAFLASHNPDSFLQTIHRAIARELSNPEFGVAELALIAKMSRTQLHRKLLELTGESPGKLIREARLQRALTLLEQGAQQVKKVAMECGFRDQTSFNRAFKSAFGHSPTEARGGNETPSSCCRWKFPPAAGMREELEQTLNSNAWLCEFFLIVIANLEDEEFSVAQLAEEMYLSTSQLNRKLKVSLEVTPGCLLRHLRLLRAGELLHNTSLSITEIAYRSGFFDHAHLTHSFNAVVGCSPSVYRKKEGVELTLDWLENLEVLQNGN